MDTSKSKSVTTLGTCLGLVFTIRALAYLNPLLGSALFWLSWIASGFHVYLLGKKRMLLFSTIMLITKFNQLYRGYFTTYYYFKVLFQVIISDSYRKVMPELIKLPYPLFEQTMFRLDALSMRMMELVPAVNLALFFFVIIIYYTLPFIFYKWLLNKGVFNRLPLY